MLILYGSLNLSRMGNYNDFLCSSCKEKVERGLQGIYCQMVIVVIEEQSVTPDSHDVV